MNERGTLWIIPDENQIMQPIYMKKVGEGISHTKEMLNFVKTFQVPVYFQESDYHEAPCMMAEIGHLIIKSADEVSKLIFYLPKEITTRQIEYLMTHQMEFMNYQKIGGYSMRIIEDGEIVWKNLHGIEEVMREVKIKNSIYERKSEENASIKR